MSKAAELADEINELVEKNSDALVESHEILFHASSLGEDGEQRAKVLKESLLSGSDPVVQRSNLISTDENQETIFAQAGTIEPPLPPLILTRLFGVSNALRQNIDAMTHNIHGFGHTFEQVIDLDSVESWELVRTAMIFERERQAELEASRDEEPKKIEEPTDQEVDERIESLKDQSRRERLRLKFFFQNACSEYSFVRIRKKLGADEETVGYGCWEVLRDGKGTPKRINPVQANTMRALPRTEPVQMKTREQYTDISWEEITEERRFRKFIQVYEGKRVYFKQYGDPRVMSANSGEYHKDEKSLVRAEGEKAAIATEILWFHLDNPESDIYGLIRWSGNILSVMGSREMEEINLLFFENKTIPPMVVLVSGGHLAADCKTEIEQVLRDHIKGTKNFHKALIIEAEPATGTSLSGIPGQNTVRIEIKPLTDAIFKDQLWGEYDASNRHKVGQSFRLPPLLRGDTKDFNRATAWAAMSYAEDQVFAPERDDFDFEINRTLIKDLGVTLWRFKSNGPKETDPEKLIEGVVKLVEAVLTPEEARPIVAAVLGVDLPKTSASWAKVPLRQALAGFESEEEEEEQGEQEKPEDQEEEKSKTLKTKVIRIPQEQFNRIVETD